MTRVLIFGLVLGGIAAAGEARAQKPAAEALKLQGDKLLEQDSVEGALASYQGAIALDPDYMAPYGALATYFLQGKEYVKTAKILSKALRRDQGYAEGWYSLAYSLRKLGRLARAIAAYKRYSKLVPNSADAYFGMGLAYKQRNDYVDAIKCFKTYVQLEKREERAAWIEKAKSYVETLERKLGRKVKVIDRETDNKVADLLGLNEKKEPEAQPEAQPEVQPWVQPEAQPTMEPPKQEVHELTLHQEKARQLKMEADKLLNAGQLEEAVAKYRASLKADYTYTPAYTELGTALFGLGRYAEAVRSFRIAVRDNPKYHQGWYNMAYALRKNGQYGAAIASYRKFSRLRPKEADPYFGLGLAYKAMKMKDSAIKAFKSYITKEKRPGQRSWINKAKQEVAVLEGRAKPPAVEPPLKKPAEEAGNSEENAKPKEGEEERRQREEELKIMAAATADKPAPAPKGAPLPDLAPAPDKPQEVQAPDSTAQGAAHELARAGKCAEALTSYQQMIKTDPFNVKAYDGLAFCAYKSGTPAVGITALKMALRDNRDYHRGWLHKARLEVAAGYHDRAVGSFRKYLNKMPGAGAVYLEMARAYRKAGVKAMAAATYKEFLRREQERDALAARLAAYVELKAMGETPPALRIPLKKGSISAEEFLQRKAAQKAANE